MMFSDKESFNRFCLGKYPGMIAYANLFLKGEDRVWVEDVVQDVLFSVWKRRFFLRDDPGKVHAYVMRSVYNRCMNYLEHSLVRRKAEEDFAEFVSRARRDYDPDNNSVMRALFDRDMREAIAKSVERLPQKQQEVFRLSYFEEKSHQEIADLLGLSVRTVDAHIYAALKNLRLSLQNI